MVRDRSQKSFDRRKYKKRLILAWALGLGFSAAVLLLGLFLQSSVVGAIGVAVLVGVAIVLHRYTYVPGGVPVVVYHSVTDVPDWLIDGDGCAVSKRTFAAHMDTLKRMSCNVMQTSDVVAMRLRGERPPENTVMVQFDDGYLDNHVAALPILRKYGFPATIFASSDFIADGHDVRPCADADDDAPVKVVGYMNRAELRAVDQDPLFAIECHSTDHGRVAVGPGDGAVLSADNWRPLVPLQWAQIDGPKAEWYRWSVPPALPLGSALPAHDSSLSGFIWRDGDVEDVQSFTARVRGELAEAKSVLEDILERPLKIMCWPFDRSNEISVKQALDLGFAAVTGGYGDNREGDRPDILSRVHFNDRAIGFRWMWAERLLFRAKLGLAFGNYYWLLLTMPANFLRKLRFRFVPPSRKEVTL